jgi:hypothetical protein
VFAHDTGKWRAKLNTIMVAVRRRVSWIVGLWLACQIAGVVAAPLAFCCQPVSAADADDCCQGVGPGQMCPMHHKRAVDNKESTCKMRDACSRTDAGLVALAGALGLLPSATIAVNSFAVGEEVRAAVPGAMSRIDRPESPPPRA